MLAITNGKLLTITSGIVENGTIIIDNGKIVSLGSALPIPAETAVIDARGGYITPGSLTAIHIYVTSASPGQIQVPDWTEMKALIQLPHRSVPWMPLIPGIGLSNLSGRPDLRLYIPSPDPAISSEGRESQ